MSTLVECVPNFSEGRDKSVVDAIVDAMKIPGVSLLDREMDSDHNRGVRYEHISNAGLTVPNPGINTVQFQVGMNWFR